MSTVWPNKMISGTWPCSLYMLMAVCEQKYQTRLMGVQFLLHRIYGHPTELHREYLSLEILYVPQNNRSVKCVCIEIMPYVLQLAMICSAYSMEGVMKYCLQTMLSGVFQSIPSK